MSGARGPRSLHALPIRFEREEGALLRIEHDRAEPLFRRRREPAPPRRPHPDRLASLLDAQHLGQARVEGTRETSCLALRTGEGGTPSPRIGAVLRVNDQRVRAVAVVELLEALDDVEKKNSPESVF